MGAIDRCYSGPTAKLAVLDALTKSIGQLFPGHPRAVWQFNDLSYITFADIRRLVRHANV